MFARFNNTSSERIRIRFTLLQLPYDKFKCLAYDWGSHEICEYLNLMHDVI
jgi:hypothetical protein